MNADQDIISLSPVPDVSYDCPACASALEPTGWYVPGMRTLATLKCGDCGNQYYGDVPSDQAKYAPMLLDRDTGAVIQPEVTNNWFCEWLKDGYSNRTRVDRDLEITRHRPLQKPALLNCLDVLYGHALLKLLNAQRFLDETDHDLVVLTHRNLSWLVPDDVAMTIEVGLPLSRGNEWNDWLADELADLFGDANLSVCLTEPNPDTTTFDIERFAGVTPFAKGDRTWSERPTVTYVWRDDRFWTRAPGWTIVEDYAETQLSERTSRHVANTLLSRSAVQTAGDGLDAILQRVQSYRVSRLASSLESVIPDVDFAVAGIGDPGELPGSVRDLCVTQPDESEERKLCERYARSHVVVGVHGSNMLLPSAHAGSTVELLPNRRWGNLTQDLVPRNGTPQEVLFFTRVLPVSTSPSTVANCIESLFSTAERFEDRRSSIRDHPSDVSD